MKDKNFNENELRKFLFQQFRNSKLKNPGFSLRAFSKKINVPSSSLSEFLNGKRHFSKKNAERILNNLKISLEEKNKIIHSKADSTQYTVLDRQIYSVIADWEHYAILSLAETWDFKSSPDWISERLGIKVPQVKRALERLKQLGLISYDEHLGFYPTGKNFSSTDEVMDISVRHSHLQSLELAENSLMHDDVNVRDFTAITMPVDLSKIAEAKKTIRKFRDKLCRDLENGKKEEVYRLSISLFPLTKIKNGENK